MKKRIITALLALQMSALSAYDCCMGEIHGFVSQGYLISTDNNFYGDTKDGTFEFNEIGLNYSVSPCDKLRAGIQLFARRLGDIGGNDLLIDWAYGDYRYRDELGIRAGKVKIPVSLHNQSRDADIARTWVLLPQSIYDESFRDFNIGVWGLDLYGHISPSCFGSFDYEVYIGSPDLDACEPVIVNYHTNIIHLLGPGLGMGEMHKERAWSKYIYGASLFWEVPIDGLRVGASGAKGIIDLSFRFADLINIGQLGKVTSDIDFKSWSAFIEYTVNCFIFTAEFMHFDLPIQIDVYNALLSDPIFSTKTYFLREGVYGSIEYLLNECVTLGSYYSIFYPNRSDKKSSVAQYQRDLDFSIRLDINDYWIVKGEFHILKGAGQLLEIDNPNGFKKNWNMALVKTSVSF